jgi:hypothetical protein
VIFEGQADVLICWLAAGMRGGPSKQGDSPVSKDPEVPGGKIMTLLVRSEMTNVRQG